jgi:flagellar basal body-associated protein FliL
VIEMDEDSKTIKRFIIIMIIVLGITVGLYFFTKYSVKKDNTSTSSSDSIKDVSIDYSNVIVGNMLNKAENEYYVILYDSSDSNASTYKELVTNYEKNDNHLTVYTADLSNKLNIKYYTSDKSNPISDNVNDLKFGNLTVIKVSNGKITNAYESVKDIKKIWKLS